MKDTIKNNTGWMVKGLERMDLNFKAGVEALAIGGLEHMSRCSVTDRTQYATLI